MKPPPHILLLVEGGSEERFMRTFLPHLGFKADVDFFLRSYGGRAHWKSGIRKELRGWRKKPVQKLGFIYNVSQTLNVGVGCPETRF